MGRALVGVVAPVVFTLVVALVIGFGVHLSERSYLTPESGVGYALGVIGSLLMLLLLGYPLRKRLPHGSRMGTVRGWFRLHMVLGVVGPVLVLFHANFSAGSTNSAVALLSMLLVATSGVVGRYLYGRIHRGLYGRRMTLEELVDAARANSARIGDSVVSAERLHETLEPLEEVALSRATGVADALSRVVSIGMRSRSLARRLYRSELAAAAATKTWPTLSRRQRTALRRKVRAAVNGHCSLLRDVAAFTLYERLFSRWHVLHVPLFFMLLATGLFHVIAVHAY
jgi:hypothetical protein